MQTSRVLNRIMFVMCQSLFSNRITLSTLKWYSGYDSIFLVTSTYDDIRYASYLDFTEGTIFLQIRHRNGNASEQRYRIFLFHPIIFATSCDKIWKSFDIDDWSRYHVLTHYVSRVHKYVNTYEMYHAYFDVWKKWEKDFKERVTKRCSLCHMRDHEICLRCSVALPDPLVNSNKSDDRDISLFNKFVIFYLICLLCHVWSILFSILERYNWRQKMTTSKLVTETRVYFDDPFRKLDSPHGPVNVVPKWVFAWDDMINPDMTQSRTFIHPFPHHEWFCLSVLQICELLSDEESWRKKVNELWRMTGSIWYSEIVAERNCSTVMRSVCGVFKLYRTECLWDDQIASSNCFEWKRIVHDRWGCRHRT